MFLRRRAYFEKDTGIIVQMTGGFFDSGYEEQPNIDRDFEVYAKLAERVRSTIDVLELSDEYEQDFENGGVMTHIDLKSLEPLFTYPDPTDPETPQEPRTALSKQVDQLAAESNANQLALMELHMMLLGEMPDAK